MKIHHFLIILLFSAVAAEDAIYCRSPERTGKNFTPTCKADFDVEVTTCISTSAFPSLAWTGSEYWISWVDDRDGNREIYFAVLDNSGRKTGKDVQVTNDFSYSALPCLIWTGKEYGMSWNHAEKVYFTRLDSEGNKKGIEIQVTQEPSYSSTPCLIKTDSDYVMSWEDYRSRNYQIHVAKLGSF